MKYRFLPMAATEKIAIPSLESLLILFIPGTHLQSWTCGEAAGIPDAENLDLEIAVSHVCKSSSFVIKYTFVHSVFLNLAL